MEVRPATAADHIHAEAISVEIASSAAKRGTGIARRSPEYLQEKMSAGHSIVALAEGRRIAGFCYIESWEDKRYVVNSGLIVFPEFRGQGLAFRIKQAALRLSTRLYPGARFFGLTTSRQVMRINSDLGYRPVTFAELTADPEFWAGCSSCVNYSLLRSKNFANCLCTGMLLDPGQDWGKRALDEVDRK